MVRVGYPRRNPLDDPFIDVRLVRSYANDFDRRLAKIMVITSAAFMVVVLMSVFLLD